MTLLSYLTINETALFVLETGFIATRSRRIQFSYTITDISVSLWRIHQSIRLVDRAWKLSRQICRLNAFYVTSASHWVLSYDVWRRARSMCAFFAVFTVMFHVWIVGLTKCFVKSTASIIY